MYPSWRLCLLLIIVLSACIHEGLSIKCWECRSDTDFACNDPMDNTSMPLTDCYFLADLPNLPGVKSTMCRKIKQKVNGKLKIIRGCAFLGEPGVEGDEKRCLEIPEKDGVYVEYCTCNSRDACNTGPTVYSNQFVVQFAAFLCFMNRFYNG